VRLTALLFAIAMTTEVAACTCLFDEPKSAFKKATGVFLGEVIEYDGTTAKLRVIESYKGREGPVAEVITTTDSAMCGYSGLTPGSRHLIYLYPETREVSICGRSKPEDRAACDLRYLRSRAAWWRSPLSSIRILQWLGLRIMQPAGCRPIESPGPIPTNG
jgi:hypothetical protein